VNLRKDHYRSTRRDVRRGRVRPLSLARDTRHARRGSVRSAPPGQGNDGVARRPTGGACPSPRPRRSPAAGQRRVHVGV